MQFLPNSMRLVLEGITEVGRLDKLLPRLLLLLLLLFVAEALVIPKFRLFYET